MCACLGKLWNGCVASVTLKLTTVIPKKVVWYHRFVVTERITEQRWAPFVGPHFHSVTSFLYASDESNDLWDVCIASNVKHRHTNKQTHRAQLTRVLFHKSRIKKSWMTEKARLDIVSVNRGFLRFMKAKPGLIGVSMSSQVWVIPKHACSQLSPKDIVSRRWIHWCWEMMHAP